MSLFMSPACEQDVDELVLREEDAGEVTEGWRVLVKGVVAIGGVEAYRDASGALAGLFGIQLLEDCVVPWLLCSDVAGKYPREVWRISTRWTARMQKLANAGYLVANQIPRQSLRNRAFIARLGFVIRECPNGPLDYFHLPPCATQS